jgi:hypothetical protein
MTSLALLLYSAASSFSSRPSCFVPIEEPRSEGFRCADGRDGAMTKDGRGKVHSAGEGPRRRRRDDSDKARTVLHLRSDFQSAASVLVLKRHSSSGDGLAPILRALLLPHRARRPDPATSRRFSPLR